MRAHFSVPLPSARVRVGAALTVAPFICACPLPQKSDRATSYRPRAIVVSFDDDGFVAVRHLDIECATHE
jgi:hypothetical protein